MPLDCSCLKCIIIRMVRTLKSLSDLLAKLEMISVYGVLWDLSGSDQAKVLSTQVRLGKR